MSFNQWATVLLEAIVIIIMGAIIGSPRDGILSHPLLSPLLAGPPWNQTLLEDNFNNASSLPDEWFLALRVYLFSSDLIPPWECLCYVHELHFSIVLCTLFLLSWQGNISLSLYYSSNRVSFRHLPAILCPVDSISSEISFKPIIYCIYPARVR